MEKKQSDLDFFLYISKKHSVSRMLVGKRNLTFVTFNEQYQRLIFATPVSEFRNAGGTHFPSFLSNLKHGCKQFLSEVHGTICSLQKMQTAFNNRFHAKLTAEERVIAQRFDRQKAYNFCLAKYPLQEQHIIKQIGNWGVNFFYLEIDIKFPLNRNKDAFVVDMAREVLKKMKTDTFNNNTSRTPILGLNQSAQLQWVPSPGNNNNHVNNNVIAPRRQPSIKKELADNSFSAHSSEFKTDNTSDFRPITSDDNTVKLVYNKNDASNKMKPKFVRGWKTSSG